MSAARPLETWPDRAEGRTARGRAGGAEPAGGQAELALLAQRVSPHQLAREELLAVPPELADLLGTPGLRRGSTLVIEAAPCPGATSLALGLLAVVGATGGWSAVVGLPDLGLLAAEEQGAALDRLVLVPAPGERAASVVNTLLGAFDLVLARLPATLGASSARRLSARARERRSVLVVTGSGVAEVEPVRSSRSAARWPERPEASLKVVSSSWEGIGAGNGRLKERRVEVASHRRRAAPEELRRELLLAAAR
ncbi:MAG: hypothetical protein JWM85_1622 [Acidimicrobiaceae bacterium]|nr:hypothetical protein [Acidimicrobiaceae bacterium]